MQWIDQNKMYVILWLITATTLVLMFVYFEHQMGEFYTCTGRYSSSECYQRMELGE